MRRGIGRERRHRSRSPRNNGGEMPFLRIVAAPGRQPDLDSIVGAAPRARAGWPSVPDRTLKGVVYTPSALRARVVPSPLVDDDWRRGTDSH